MVFAPIDAKNYVSLITRSRPYASENSHFWTLEILEFWNFGILENSGLRGSHVLTRC